MTAAPNLPDRRERTVDDLDELPPDMPITIDLPALSRRRALLLEQAAKAQ